MVSINICDISKRTDVILSCFKEKDLVTRMSAAGSLKSSMHSVLSYLNLWPVLSDFDPESPAYYKHLRPALEQVVDLVNSMDGGPLTGIHA